MEKIKGKNLINYVSSGKDENRDLYVTVELSDELYGEDELKVIDRAMKKFYKEYGHEMRKLWEKKYGKIKN